MENTASGVLMVKPLKAHLTVNCETFSRMDPFVRVTVGDRQVQSKPAKNMHQEPHWGDVLTTRLGQEKTIRVEVYHENKIRSPTFLGEAYIPNQIIRIPQPAQRYNLTDQGQQTGWVEIDFEFVPDGLGASYKGEDPYASNVAVHGSTITGDSVLSSNNFEMMQKIQKAPETRTLESAPVKAAQSNVIHTTTFESMIDSKGNQTYEPVVQSTYYKPGQTSVQVEVNAEPDKEPHPDATQLTTQTIIFETGAREHSKKNTETTPLEDKFEEAKN